MRLLVAVVALLALPATAQAPLRSADIVSWSIATRPIARGGTTDVVLRATIAPGWRLYALGSPVGRPLELVVETVPPGVEALAPEQSRPREGYDVAFEQSYSYFAGAAEVRLPLRASRSATPGRHRVTGTLRYAVCDDSICLPPAASPFRTQLTVR